LIALSSDSTANGFATIDADGERVLLERGDASEVVGGGGSDDAVHIVPFHAVVDDGCGTAYPQKRVDVVLDQDVADPEFRFLHQSPSRWVERIRF